jgi:outer membrane protein assembly factor BamB
MKIVWTSEAFSGQSLSTVTYFDGYVYAGTTKTPAGDTSGTFYCLDAANGRTVWTYENEENSCGYYWSGGIVYGNAIYFAGDNGILVSHSLTSSDVYATKILSKNGKIRAGITCDTKNGLLYTTSNDGTVYRIEVSTDGKILSILDKKIIAGSKSANCTSTPTVWNNRLYVGSLADAYGYLSVLDATTLEPYYHVRTGQYKEVKSSALVSTGFSKAENNQTVYVYFTCNAVPGGVYMIEDNETAKSASLQTVYEPTQKQYCISSVFADTDGTLYYSNDSGNLFALQELSVNTDASLSSAIKKPSKLRWKYKKQKWILSFQKNEKNSQTLIYVRYNSGKWKKIKSTTGSQCKLSLKKKKKIYIRMRNRKKDSNQNWSYSPYTKTYRIR